MLMKKISLLLFSLFFLSKTYASHIASTELRYEYTGVGNIYRIYLTTIKLCELNTQILSDSENITYSSSCYASTSRLIPKISDDTIQVYCPNYVGSCSNATSNYFGFERKIYSDTITLPPCNDWIIAYSTCCRNGGILNLNTAAYSNSECQAFLNNSLSINSSPYLPSPAIHIVKLNQLNIIPVQAVDVDNDSLVYEWYQPGGTAYIYNYSVIDPFGGGVSILDSVNQVMKIKVPIQGKFDVAFRLKEYRSGILVGYSSRDFEIISLNFAADTTIPMPVTGNIMHYVSCPGQTNTINLSFMDSTATDSVYLTVIPPTLTGYTFNTTTNAGLGNANATITFTTPSSLNPATLPHFFINIQARDNGCPQNAFSYYAVAVENIQCNTDSVWTGDANADYTVNNYDPLAVAVAYGKAGVTRPNASTLWQAQFCYPWADTFSNGINMKHADCNGDGWVDTLDLAAISQNYGSVHVKPGVKAKTTGVPNLRYDISGIGFYPGATVSIPITLGDAVNPMNNLYGLATTISISNIALTSPPQITYPTSWLGNVSNTLKFTKSSSNNSVDWAYSRIDHQQINGQGIIAYINFTIPTTATIGTKIDLNFSNTKLIDKKMNDINNFNTIDTSAIIQPLSVSNMNQAVNYAFVIPNPSSNKATLQMMLTKNTELNIVIADVTGKTLSTQHINADKGENNIQLPAATLNSGMYFIKIFSNQESHSIKWIRL